MLKFRFKNTLVYMFKTVTNLNGRYLINLKSLLIKTGNTINGLSSESSLTIYYKELCQSFVLRFYKTVLKTLIKHSW